MDAEEFRSSSVARLAKAGIAVPANLPLLDEFLVRPLAAILDRILCLNAVAAAAHGFDKEKALSWLSQEGMSKNLTEQESSFLRSGVGRPDTLKVQVEGIWALTWVVGITTDLDFWLGCDPHFVTMLPDLKTSERSTKLRSRAQRSNTEIGAKCDLAYCLHWALRDAELCGAPPTGIEPFVVVERRRALEWAISGEDWDAVSLDT